MCAVDVATACITRVEENKGACSVLFWIGTPASAGNREQWLFQGRAVAEEPARGSFKGPQRITGPVGEERHLLLIFVLVGNQPAL